MRTLKKNGHLLRLIPLPSPSEENQHCPNCRSQYDPVKIRRAQYVACKHFTCLECVLSSKGGCNQCPVDVQNDDDGNAKCKGKKVGLPPLLPINPEEEENTPKLGTENGTCSATPAPAEPAIVSLVKKPVEIVGEQQNKKSEVESEIQQSSRMEVIDLEPINGDFEEMMDTSGKKEGEKVINSSTASLLVDEANSGGSDCDVVFIKRKDATSRLSEAYKLNPFTCDSGKEIEVHPCPHCGIPFSAELFLHCHISLHHRPHDSDPLGSSLQSEEEFENHQRTPHHSKTDGRYKCTKCDAIYSERYRLDEHVRLMHPTTTANGSNLGNDTPRESISPSFIAKNRMSKETKKLTIGGISQRDFKCDICPHTFYKKSHKLSHMLNKHRIRMRLTSEDLARKNELGDDGKYCPECQSEFDEDPQGVHIMVAFSTCGHLCCLQCAIRDADLGCGQCTTETVAPKTQCPSASSSSSLKKIPSMEIGDRRKSKRKVVKPLKLRDSLDLKQVDELIGNDDDEQDSGVGEKRQKRRAFGEPPRTNRGGRPKGSLTKRRISTSEEGNPKQEEESSKSVKDKTTEPKPPRKGPGRRLGSLRKFKKQIGLKETVPWVLPPRAKLARRRKALVRRESQENTGKLGVHNSPKTGLNDKWKCRFCNEMFARRKLLAEHMQEKHRDNLPVQCDICQWSFHSRRDRDRHIIRRHTTASGGNKQTILKTVSHKRRFKCEDQHPRKIRGPYKKRIEGWRLRTYCW